jgi:hypothetical protein
MIEDKNNKVFELYNRKSDVVRCPYGRAIVREKLDSYAKALSPMEEPILNTMEL